MQPLTKRWRTPVLRRCLFSVIAIGFLKPQKIQTHNGILKENLASFEITSRITICLPLHFTLDQKFSEKTSVARNGRKRPKWSFSWNFRSALFAKGRRSFLTSNVSKTGRFWKFDSTEKFLLKILLNWCIGCPPLT